jgi:hypothetical protein
MSPDQFHPDAQHPVPPLPPQPQAPPHRNDPHPDGIPPAFRKHKLFPVHPPVPATVDPRSIQAGHSVSGVEDLRALTVTTCRLTLQQNQSISSGTGHTAVVPGSTLADKENMWDGTHAYVRIPWKATWEVSYTARFESSNTTGYRLAQAYRSTDSGANFNAVTKSIDIEPSPTGAIGTVLHNCFLDAYERGDLIRVDVTQNSGGPINVVQFDLTLAYRGAQ